MIGCSYVYIEKYFKYVKNDQFNFFIYKKQSKFLKKSFGQIQSFYIGILEDT